MKQQILHTDGAPRAIGPYSQAVKIGNTVYTSGQLGLDPRTGDLPAGIENQARTAMQNIGAILAAAGLGYENIVKTTIFLQDLAKGGLVEIECVAVDPTEA